MNELLDAAIAYAAMGWAVFPCKPHLKTPMTLHGVKDASTDPDTIRAWWNKWPNANIGLACGEPSGVYVADIDVDEEKGVNGFASLAELGPTPHTVKQTTPRGGAHYFYRAAVPPRNKNGMRPGIDIRGTGYYVILAPSVNGNGKSYAWENPPTTTELAEWPECLRPEAEKPVLAWDKPRAAPRMPAGASDIRKRASAYLAAMEPAMQGHGGHDALLKAASALVVGFGLSQAEATAMLWAEFNPRCSPPWDAGKPSDRRDFERKVTEALKTATKPAGYLLDDMPDVSAAHIEIGRKAQLALLESCAPKPTEPPKPPPADYRIPDHLLTVPGLVSKVVDYCLATAPYPNRTLAFAGALALQAFLCSRKVRTESDIRPNIYLLALAPSGAGKDWPRKLNKEILYRAGFAGAVGDRFASAEGIEDEIFRSPALLMQTDEIDGMIQAMGKRGEPLQENMMSMLLSMYGSSSTYHYRRKKAGDQTGGSVSNPHLILFGTAIPIHFYAALNERMLTNGLFARMIVLDAAMERKGQKASVIDPPADMVGIAKWWRDFKPGGDLADANPEPITVHANRDAEDAFADLRIRCDERYNRAGTDDETVRTVFSRVAEQAQKLALIYASSADAGSPVIDGPAATWASELAVFQANRMLGLADKYSCPSETEAVCQRLIAKIGAAGGSAEHSVLLKRSHMDKRDFANAIATLIEREDVRIETTQTAGRPTRKYIINRGNLP